MNKKKNLMDTQQSKVKTGVENSNLGYLMRCMMFDDLIPKEIITGAVEETEQEQTEQECGEGCNCEAEAEVSCTGCTTCRSKS
jgi:hypothetical protein